MAKPGAVHGQTKKGGGGGCGVQIGTQTQRVSTPRGVVALILPPLYFLYYYHQRENASIIYVCKDLFFRIVWPLMHE